MKKKWIIIISIVISLIILGIIFQDQIGLLVQTGLRDTPSASSPVTGGGGG